MALANYDVLAIIIISIFLVLRFKFNFASRSIVVLALFLLAVAALFNGIGNSTTANDLVIVAFYSLVVGIVLLTYDQVRVTRGPMKKEGPLYRSYARMKDLFNRLRS